MAGIFQNLGNINPQTGKKIFREKAVGGASDKFWDLTCMANSSCTDCLSSGKALTPPISPIPTYRNDVLDLLSLTSLPSQKFKGCYHCEGSIPFFHKQQYKLLHFTV